MLRFRNAMRIPVVLFLSLSALVVGLARQDVTSVEIRDLRGEVVGFDSQQPLAGATIEIRTNRGHPRSSLKTANGAFSLQRSGQDRLLVVSAPGYATTRMAVETDQEFVRVEMRRAASVSGVVRHTGTGEGIDQATIAVRQIAAQNHILSSVRTTGGSFTIAGLHPGAALLVIRADGFAPEISNVEVSEGERVEGLTLSLSPATDIEGRIVDGVGQPISGASVTVQYLNMQREERFTLERLVSGRLTTTADGVFRLKNVIPGTDVRIRAAAGDRIKHSAVMRLSAGVTPEQLTLSLP